MTQLKMQSTAERIELLLPGDDNPILVQQATPNTRAYIHPILMPGGHAVLTEDTPDHHPWQHGLYVGLNDVNGIGFWTEGLQENRRSQDGTFHPQPIVGTKVDQNQANWTVSSQWRDPNGMLMLTETQNWCFTHHGDTYDLDLCWSLSAAIDLSFGQYAYGGLFLPMPYKKELGGEAVNSQGQINKPAEGQRARWVSVSIPIEGLGADGWAGIAIMDHSTNPEHPNPWRVDGQLGIAPSRCIAGHWGLSAGETTTSRYRLFVFGGRSNMSRVDANWTKFNT